MKLTLRERFNRFMRFEEVDRVPNQEIGYWDETVECWYQEGLPRNVLKVHVGACTPKSVEYDSNDLARARAIQHDTLFPRAREVGLTEYFGFDRHMFTHIGPITWDPMTVALPRPPSPKILKDEGVNVVWEDGFGAIYREQKRMKSIPQFLKYAVETMKDWEAIKARLDPSTLGRYPKNWDKIVRMVKKRAYPICIMYGGFWCVPRGLMGTPNLCKALYMNPELVLDINEHWCYFIIEVIRKALEEVDYDYILISEDMAYKGRAMMSPAHFRKFMLPFYKRLTKFLKERGLDVVMVDSDGYMHGLIPLLIEGGITGTWPLEVAAGNDLTVLSRKYRKNFILSGGINKYALALGPEAIDKELSKLPPLLEAGGYLPTVDHMIQPNVSLANMMYYAKAKKRIILEVAKS